MLSKVLPTGRGTPPGVGFYGNTLCFAEIYINHLRTIIRRYYCNANYRAVSYLNWLVRLADKRPSYDACIVEVALGLTP